MPKGRPISDRQAVLLREAKDRGLSKYDPEEPCLYGHISLRYVSNNRCIACASEMGRVTGPQWRNKNAKYYAQFKKRYSAAHRKEENDRRRQRRREDGKFREMERLQRRRHRERHKERLSAEARIYRERHKESLSAKERASREKYKDRYREYNRRHYEKNKEAIKEASRKWRKDNPEKVRAFAKEWRVANREKYMAYIRKGNKKYYAKVKDDPMFVVSNRMRVSVYHALRSAKNGRSWEALVGYSASELKTHLENKFTEGMSWEKFLEGEIHIDHIRPVSYFSFTTDTDPDFVECWSLTNLQPLWAIDNILKSNKQQAA